MATIMIYEPNEIIAQKLCDSLKKEKYNAIRCDENVIPSFSSSSRAFLSFTLAHSR